MERTEPNRIRHLQAIGQSIWYDNIHRELIDSGELRRLIGLGITGITSNPTIFEKALAGGGSYDRDLPALLDRDPTAIFEALAGDDIRRAADLLRPVYEDTAGQDGFVSLEVSPVLAHDTAATVEEARRLWRQIDRPNLMIKVPATPAGMPAIATLIGEGINVNVTLIFSLAAYEQVMNAYLTGLEQHLAAGHAIERVASVASFFVSRVDTAVDRLIAERLEQPADEQARERLAALRGQAGIANAVRAFARFRTVFSSERFDALAVLGARVQRPLWASTSTKDPALPDTYYVDALAGPDTVNTLPPQAIDAVLDHGRVAARFDDLDWADRVVRELAGFGIDLDAVTDQLLAEGVDSFARSFESLLAGIAAKRTELPARSPQPVAGGAGPAGLDRALADLEGRQAVCRIWEHDPSLWKDDPEHQREIRERLGWLTVAGDMRDQVADLHAFREEARAAGIQDVVLCGMGGSSLCAEVLGQTFGRKDGYPRLTVLDSTDPVLVAGVAERIDPRRTLFLIASKSGGTIEVDSLNRFFWERVQAACPDRPGDQFVAITDPGTSLERLGRERGFRRVFLNPPDIGGRFSALSLFGLVPAALIGLDVGTFLERGDRMADACRPDGTGAANPGLRLGALLGGAAGAGRDKLTLLTSPRLAALGLWVEQLIAESTGKEGRGIVPVTGEPLGPPEVYGSDRCFVAVRLAGDDNADLDRGIDALRTAGREVEVIDLADPYDLAAEFYRWEFATAVAGVLLGVDVFDQPNVQESKDNTGRYLAAYEQERRLPDDPPGVTDGSLAIWGAGKSLEDALAGLLGSVRPGDYLALLAYLTPDAATDRALTGLRVRLRDLSARPATTDGYGPRYLHSTGQLHKGGPDTGIFILLTASSAVTLAIPGRSYDFGTLKACQALGDEQALRERGRRTLRIHLGADLAGGLAQLGQAIEQVGRRG